MKNLKLSFIILTAVFFTGCSLTDEKKSDIDLKAGQEAAPVEEMQEKEIEAIPEEVAPETGTDLVEKEPVVSVEKNTAGEKEAVAPAGQKEEDAPKASGFKIIDKLASWGYQKASGRKIDTIIVHSSYNALGGDIYDLGKIIGIYKSYEVAPHYIISRDGQVYRMVEDKNIAYHAGQSKMPDGRTDVNGFSIGIEMVNSKTEGPTSAQYASLKELIKKLKSDHGIKYTLGHADIAPGRKDDPWKFNWDKLD